MSPPPATPLPTSTRTLTAPPAPTDDVAAIRAAAAALRALAAELRRWAAELTAAVPPSWHGVAATAAANTAHRLATALTATAHALDEDATALDAFATVVAVAKLHHHHWLRILGEVAGTVAVTALVVTATMATGGAAGVVLAGAALDAEVDVTAAGAVGTVVASSSSLAAGTTAAAGTAEATAGAAVAGMGGAVAEASTAEATLIESLTSRLLATLPKLKPLAQQQLVGAEIYTGVETSVHIVASGHIDLGVIPVELVTNIATGMGVAGVAGKIGGPFARLAGGGSLIKGRGVVAGIMRHLGSGVGSGGITATEEELRSGRISAGDVGESAAEGTLGSAAGDLGAASEPRISRGINRVRALRLPALAADADGRVATAVTPGGVYRVDPRVLRFSQKSVNRLGLRRDALSGGWHGEPIEVVLMPDGKLTSLDNRRIAVSRDLGIEAQVRVHAADEPLPAELLASRRFTGYGLSPGSTWQDLIAARLRKQGAWGRANPSGSPIEPPKVTEGMVQVIGIRAPLVVVTRAK